MPIAITPEIRRRYKFRRNTFTAEEAGFEVEVGDINQPDFKPQVKLRRWHNEANASFRLLDTSTGLPVVRTQGKRIKWVRPKIEAHFYQQPSDSQNEDGSYEFEVILKEKPATNKLRFSIQTKGLDFFYQPPLTPEEIAEGYERPDNVVGSYAVYHKTQRGDYTALGGKNYKTGKAFHIYRPKIVDSAGNWTWGSLKIRAGVLTVTIPQDFLDTAVYPIKHAAGLTFGYTSVGASASNFYDGVISGTQGTLGSSGTVSKLTAYLTIYTAGTLVRGAIYNSDGTYASNETEEKSGLTTGIWTDFAFASPPVKAAATYYLAFWSDGGLGDTRLAADTGSSGQLYDSSLGVSYPNWPTVDGLSSTFIKSIYATYSAPYVTGAASLSGVGTLAAIAGLTLPAAAVLAGAGSLTVAGTTGSIRLGAASLSGAGTLAAAGVETFAGKVTMDGTGTLTAVAERIRTGAASLAGVGSLSAIGETGLEGRATLAGVGTLTVVAQRIVPGQAVLAGAGSLSAAGVITAIGQAALSGVGTMTVFGSAGTVKYTQFGIIFFDIDPDDYPAGTVFTFWGILKVNAPGDVSYARLYNITDAAEVADSEITFTSTDFQFVKSPLLTLPSGPKNYRAEYGGTAGGIATIGTARLRIESA